jgi:hypothetical protein
LGIYAHTDLDAMRAALENSRVRNTNGVFGVGG